MARRRIEVEIIGNSRSLGAALGRSAGQLDTFAQRVRAIGTQVQSTGRTLTRGITIPAVGVAAASVKMGLDFEESMTHIRALVGASAAQMEDYRAGVLELGEVVPQGPQELADALYFVTSSGFEGAAALDVLTASAKAAAAGLGDTTLVADAVTSAVNAYGEANLDASKATDVLLATVREGKAEPEALAEVIGRVIAPAEAMGVAFGEVGGAVAGLTLGGLDAAEAVTGLRGIFGTLLKPTEQARELLDKAGMSVDGIRKAVADKGLLPTLQMLRDRFGKNKDALGKLFPNVRALNAFLSLTGRNAKKNAEAMKDVAGAVGDTDKAVQKAGEDPAFKMRVAWSKLRVALIELSTTLIPIVTRIVGVFSSVLDAFEDLSPSTKRMIAGFVLVAAVLGPLLVSVGSLVVLVGVIGSTIGVVIIALVALGAGLVALYTKSETFRELVGKAWVYIQEQAARFMAWYDGTLRPAIENVLSALSAAWARFGEDVKEYVRTAFEVVMSIVRPVLRTLKGYIEFILAVIRGDWSAAWAALKSIVRAQLDLAIAAVKATPKLFLAAARLVGGAVWAGIKAGIGALGAKIGELFGRAKDAVLGWVDDFLSWGKDLGGAIIDGILEGLRNAGSSIGSTLRGLLPDPGGGVPFIEGIATGARDWHGGMALVGERGPELVNLPRGSDVYTARQTRGMLGSGSANALEGLRIAGTLDLKTGSLEGIIVGRLDAAGRAQRRRRRMGAE